MAEGEPDTDKEAGVRKTTTLAAPTIRFLEKLATKGTHGTSVPAVMRSLIEQGIRQAIKDEFIKLSDGDPL